MVIETVLPPAESGLFILVTRTVLAGMLGGLVGWQREANGQAAGLRTNMLVALAGCLIMQMSTEMEGLFRMFGAESVVRLDPSRMAAYTLTGMGFLGAGAIIKGKGSVRGLTTAAGLWLVNGIGLAVGAGMYMMAVVTTLVSLVILSGGLVRWIQPKTRQVYSLLTVRCRGDFSGLDKVRSIIDAVGGVRVDSVDLKKDRLEGWVEYRLRLMSGNDLPRWRIAEELEDIEGLESIYWNEADVP